MANDEEQRRPLLNKNVKYYANCPGCKVDRLKETRKGYPIKEFSYIGLLVLCNALPISSLFPFLYFMVNDFHIAKTQKDIGFYAGYIGSAFMFGRFLTSVLWGMAADKYGRKPIMLSGAITVVIFNTLFGLSSNFWMAISMRFLLGSLNGLLGPVKAYAAEVCREEHQALGLSIVGTTWGIGLIIGPAIGGFFAQPADKYPHIFSKDSLFGRFPYFLPCLCISIFALVASMVAFQLPETLHKHPTNGEDKESNVHDFNANDVEEQDPELGSKVKCIEENKEEVIKRQTMHAKSLLRNWPLMSSIIIYCVFSLHDIAYTEIFSLWAVSPKEYGGLNFTSSNVGEVLAISEYRQRIDLIQDMKFNTAATRIKSTPDGEYIIISGIYPPQVKVYELRQLSLKFERHLVAEIIDFQVLGDDYSKLAFLCADRSVCLHAKYGSHYSLRIPRMGRDIAYDRWSCDLLCAASSPDLYRINLEQGRFLASLSTRSPAINVICRSPVHGLVACGGEDGALECFDLRQKAAVGRINAVAPTGESDQEVTAVRFDETEGFVVAVGTSAGQVLIYDLRSSGPLCVKDHMYGSPILDIKWHETMNSTRPRMITTDNRVVRIWDPETAEGITSIEPTAGNINDVCVIRNSGLVLMALESAQVPSYFIPALGPAPKWCSYLENLTEELEEEAQTTIYDDFKFITKEDLERLNLTNLIGTNLLRAYMHGFFIDYRLFLKAKSMADPFAYEAYRKQRIQEKIEAERAARITIKRKLPKVNKRLAARLLATEDTEVDENDNEDGEVAAKNNSKKKKKGTGRELLKDERFAAMFHDEQFEVDEFSPEYLSLHPNKAKNKPSLVEEHFEPVNDDSQEESQEITDTDASSSEEDFSFKKRKKGKIEQKGGSARVPRLYEIKDESHAQAFRNHTSLAEEYALPLEKRIEAIEKKAKSNSSGSLMKGQGGSREISFTSHSLPESKSNYHLGQKRGIQSLRLKPERQPYKGGGRGRGRGGPRGRSSKRGKGRS